jgi:hypothetical protein
MERTKNYLMHTGVCSRVHHKEQYIPQKELEGERYSVAPRRRRSLSPAALAAAAACCRPGAGCLQIPLFV